MAVESRFVVIRHGVEAKTFMDKKSADEYDKMLDMADNLAEVFAQSSLKLTESLSEELSIYLAQNRDDVLVALLAKKPAKPVVKKTPKLVDVNEAAVEVVEDKITPESIQEQASKVAKAKLSKAKAAKVSKAKKNKADESISEAS